MQDNNNKLKSTPIPPNTNDLLAPLKRIEENLDYITNKLEERKKALEEKLLAYQQSKDAEKHEVSLGLNATLKKHINEMPEGQLKNKLTPLYMTLSKYTQKYKAYENLGWQIMMLKKEDEELKNEGEEVKKGFCLNYINLLQELAKTKNKDAINIIGKLLEDTNRQNQNFGLMLIKEFENDTIINDYINLLKTLLEADFSPKQTSNLLEQLSQLDESFETLLRAKANIEIRENYNSLMRILVNKYAAIKINDLRGPNGEIAPQNIPKIYTLICGDFLSQTQLLALSGLRSQITAHLLALPLPSEQKKAALENALHAKSNLGKFLDLTRPTKKEEDLRKQLAVSKNNPSLRNYFLAAPPKDPELASIQNALREISIQEEKSHAFFSDSETAPLEQTLSKGSLLEQKTEKLEVISKETLAKLAIKDIYELVYNRFFSKDEYALLSIYREKICDYLLNSRKFALIHALNKEHPLGVFFQKTSSLSFFSDNIKNKIEKEYEKLKAECEKIGPNPSGNKVVFDDTNFEL